MKNIKNIAKGFLLLSFLVGVAFATPALADNNKGSSNNFFNVQASLKADALIKLDSSTGVVLGPNGVLRVMGAKVVSVSSGEISATAPFGNSSLNFVVKTDAQTKLNGKLLTDASVLSQLKAGDKISFAGTITSSTSSSIVVDGDHVVSQALYNNGKIENKNSFQGEIRAVDSVNNSFTVKLKSGVTVKVALSSSTVITLDGVVTTLASLKEGDEVKITGELNSDGTIITASKVSVASDDNDSNDDNNGKKDEEKDKNENKGWFGKFRNWFWK
jgi:hypothetical protein